MRNDDAINWVREQLRRMERNGVWPQGERDLWTDAHGVVLLASLYHEFGDASYRDRAEWVVDDVERRLGAGAGLGVAEEAEAPQSYRHLTKWLYALRVLSEHDSSYREQAVALARAIHGPFVEPELGAHRRLTGDLGRPAAGSEPAPAVALDGYVVYRLVDEEELGSEIAQLEAIVEANYREMRVEQELTAGTLLWLTHFFPDEAWARTQRDRALEVLDALWTDPPGYVCRRPGRPETVVPFANYGVALGLQAVDRWPERVERIHRYFDAKLADGPGAAEAITRVTACCSHYPGEWIRAGR